MITDRIELCLVKHDADTGRPAKRIYLGRQEWRELRDYAAGVCCFFIAEPHTEDHRAEYLGRKIFEVDAEEHLGVA